jgi:hypothetical protein
MRERQLFGCLDHDACGTPARAHPANPASPQDAHELFDRARYAARLGDPARSS